MTENQRMQFDRPDLRERSTGVRVKSRGRSRIFMVVASAIALVARLRDDRGLDGWAQWVVLAGIVVTVVGAMIAVSPNRKA